MGSSIVENMTDYQVMWMIYLAGAVGCCLATWLLFRRAGRAWVHFFVITIMVLLLTPYAVEAENMVMAPALYTVIFGYMTEGFLAVKPVIKLMLGLWLGALVLSLVYQLLTRNRAVAPSPAHSRQQNHSSRNNTSKNYVPNNSTEQDYSPKPRSSARDNSRELSREERRARDELLRGEEPIRAVR